MQAASANALAAAVTAAVRAALQRREPRIFQQERALTVRASAGDGQQAWLTSVAGHGSLEAAGRRVQPATGGRRPPTMTVAELRAAYGSVKKRRGPQRESPTIVIEYGATRRPPVHARLVGMAAAQIQVAPVISTALVPRSDAVATVRTAGALTVLTGQSMREAVSDAQQAIPRYTLAERQRLADAGMCVRQSDITEAQRMWEALLLVQVLPMYALAEITGRTEARVRATLPLDIVRHAMRRARGRWAPQTIAAARRAWVRLMLWLARRDVEHDGRVDGITYADYLDDVDVQARRAAAERQQRREQQQTALARRGQQMEVPLRKPQDGSHAADGQESNLSFLARHWGVEIPLKAGKFVRRAGHSRPQPAISPSVWAVQALEDYVCGVPPLALPEDPVANAIGGLLFMCHGSLRCEQAQSCYVEAVGLVPGVLEPALHGVVVLDKHPNPEKRFPRPFWLMAAGLRGDGAWLLRWAATVLAVEGAAQACCVFLENDSPDGNPFLATRLYAVPMSKDRVLVAIRAIMERVCRMTQAQAAAFTLHSARHFLPCVAEARSEPPERAVEVGRWSGSVAQDSGLVPSVPQARAHVLRLRAMPERYGQHAGVPRVCNIILDQVRAARELVAAAARRREPLPILGGWHLLGAPSGDAAPLRLEG